MMHDAHAYNAPHFTFLKKRNTHTNIYLEKKKKEDISSNRSVKH